MYISLDIETTGLSITEDQILSIAMVADDLKRPIDELDKFYMTIKRKRYSGNAVALAMNAATLLEIENGVKDLPHKNVIVKQTTYDALAGCGGFIRLLQNWLEQVYKDYWKREGLVGQEFKPIFAGKNVAMFDLPFIQQAYNKHPYLYPFAFSHRIIDVGSMYYDPKIDGSKVPNLTECKKRAGILTSVSHHALDDAMDVVHCIRAKNG